MRLGAGGLHYYVNDYCDPGSILATFNNADPGTVVATDVSARHCALSCSMSCGCEKVVPQLAYTKVLTAPAELRKCLSRAQGLDLSFTSV